MDNRNFFDQPLENNIRGYEIIRKLAADQGVDYTIGGLLDYTYFKKSYKVIATDLSRQQALDADPKAIQQINFTGKLDRVANTTMFFILEEAKKNIFGFSQGIARVL